MMILFFKFAVLVLVAAGCYAGARYGLPRLIKNVPAFELGEMTAAARIAG